MTKVWREITRFGVINKDQWITLPPLTDADVQDAVRIYAEHGALAKGEPFGTGDETRTGNGTMGELAFARWAGQPWSGGVTVAVPRSVIADVGTDIQVYTSPEPGARLIVHRDELIPGQRWVHVIGRNPTFAFVGWLYVEQIEKVWDAMPEDPRRTGGRAFATGTLNAPSTW